MNQRLKNLIIDTLVIAFLVSVTWCAFGLQWDDVDDVQILEMISGIRTGLPSPFTLHEGFIFGLFISFLYTICGTVPWYTLALISFMYVSMVLIFHILRVNETETVKQFFIRLFIFVSVYIGLFLWPVVQLQYMTVTAFPAAAIICLVIRRNSCNDAFMSDKSYLILLSVLGFITFELRMGTVLMFSAVTVFTYLIFIISRQKKLNELLPELLILSSIFIIVITSNILYEKSIGMYEFKHEYDGMRSSFVDYQTIPYSEGEDVYINVNWDEPMYELAKEFYLMDESINIDTFKTIDSAKKIRDSRNLLIKLKDGIRVVYGYSYYNNLCLVIIITCFICLLLFFLINSSATRWQLVMYVGYTVGFALSSLAIAIKGRFPQRIFIMLLIVFMVPASYQLVITVKDICTVFGKTAQKYISLLACSSAMLILLCLMICGSTQITKRMLRSDDVRCFYSLEDYCHNNSDNLYIYDPSVVHLTSPLSTREKSYANNLMFWGGWQAYSKFYYDQLNANGYSELYSKDFFSENIFFVSKDAHKEMLYDYMKARYPGCTIETVDMLEDMTIYRFNR